MISGRKFVGISLALCLGVTAIIAVKAAFFAPKREVVIKTSQSQKAEKRPEKTEAPEQISPEAAQEVALEKEVESTLLNINTATAAELDELTGIGPALAEEIVNYRAEKGKFKSIEDIMDVSGIGKARFGAISADITVGEIDNEDTCSR